MPDKRCHRGPHPDDATLFAPAAQADLRRATADVSLLLSRGYAIKSALSLVGNRYRLTTRQRSAVRRSACSDGQLEERKAKCVCVADLAGQGLAIDGYNLLISVEAALGGGFLFAGRDGCLRDLASVHGTYRRVEETKLALQTISDALTRLEAGDVQWLLDRPVSNSARLKAIILEVMAAPGRGCDVQLCYNPDSVLAGTERIVVSSDSAILDQCDRWTALASFIVRSRVPQARVIDLCVGSTQSG